MVKKSPSKAVEESDDLPTKPIGDVAYRKSFVIYGRSGTGKTTLASSFPGPILYANIRDNGTDSIADVKGIQVFELEDLDDLEELRMWLRKNRKEIAKGKYKTLILDTMSQLQELYVEEVGKKKAKKKDKKPGEWGSMTKQDWGEVASEMKALIIELRNLPMNVVFIAQDKTFNFDDDAGSIDEQLVPEIGPRLMPSVVSVLNAAVSVIACTFIRRRIIKTKSKEKPFKTTTKEKIEYCLRIGPSPIFTTKVRKPKSTTAPDYIVDPDYDDIIDIINGDYDNG
jgi:phage nucleotide-binding protein